MRHPDIDYMIVMERRRDELAEAERYRMVKAARAAQPRAAGSGALLLQAGRLAEALALFLARLLSLAGERMLTWSCRLQTRYALLAGAREEQPSPCG